MKLSEVTSQTWEFIIDRPEKQKQGVYLYYKGVPYPRRLYYDRLNDIYHDVRALEALGVVKKYLFSLTYLSKLVILRTLNIKKYEAFLSKLEEMCRWPIAQYLLKDDEWSVPVWELGKFIKAFLVNLGLSEELAWKWARIAMCVLEFDCAYRYRVQDLFGVIQWLDRKTLGYIYEIYKQREGMYGASEKIDKIIKLLQVVLWIPKFSKALKKAHEGIDFNKIRFDINDIYHTSYWRGYDFGGKDFETRYKFFLETHKGNFPPYNKRKDPQETANFLLGV